MKRPPMTSNEGMQRVNMLRVELLRLITAHVDSLEEVDARSIASAAVGLLYAEVMLDGIIFREKLSGDPTLEVACKAMGEYPWQTLFGPVLERRRRDREAGQT